MFFFLLYFFILFVCIDIILLFFCRCRQGQRKTMVAAKAGKLKSSLLLTMKENGDQLEQVFRCLV
jgi:hypothetical protein